MLSLLRQLLCHERSKCVHFSNITLIPLTLFTISQFLVTTAPDRSFSILARPLQGNIEALLLEHGGDRADEEGCSSTEGTRVQVLTYIILLISSPKSPCFAPRLLFIAV